MSKQQASIPELAKTRVSHLVNHLEMAMSHEKLKIGGIPEWLIHGLHSIIKSCPNVLCGQKAVKTDEIVVRID